MDQVRKNLITFIDGPHDDDGFCSNVRLFLEGKDPSLHTQRMVALFFADSSLQTPALPIAEALAFREAVVRPFITPSLKCNNALVAGCVGRMIVWWKDHLPTNQKLRTDMMDDLFSLLVREVEYHYKGVQYRNFRQIIADKKNAKLNKDKPALQADSMMHLLKQATTCKNSSGCNALFELIDFIMSRPEFTEFVLFDAFYKRTASILKVLDIFFDPLVITKVYAINQSSEMLLPNSDLLGREQASNVRGSEHQWVKVEWSDGRSDYLFQGSTQNRTPTREVTEKMVCKLLRSRTGNDVLILSKFREALSELDLKRMGAAQALNKFRQLLEETIKATHEARAEQRDTEVSIDLSRKILTISLSKAVMHVDQESVQDVFGETLLRMALAAPQWWSAVTHYSGADDKIAQDISTLQTKLRRYIVDMRKEVRLHLLESIYQCLDQPLDDSQLAPWSMFLSNVVQAAEARSCLDHLAKQPQGLWDMVTSNLEFLAASDDMSRTVAIISNRTRENLLSHVLVPCAHLDSETSCCQFLEFCNTMFTDNLCTLWKARCDDASMNSLVDCMDHVTGLLERPAEHTTVYVNFIRGAYSLVDGVLRSQSKADLSEETLVKMATCIIRLFTWKGDCFGADDIRAFGHLTIALVAKRPAFAVLAGIEISKDPQAILRTSFEPMLFSKLLVLLHAADNSSTAESGAKQTSTLSTFLKALVCDLEYSLSEGEEFNTRSANLHSLHACMSEPDTSKSLAFVLDAVSSYIPALFDALGSPHKAHVSALLAKVLHFSVEDMGMMHSDNEQGLEEVLAVQQGEDDSSCSFYCASSRTSHGASQKKVQACDFEEESKKLVAVQQHAGGANVIAPTCLKNASKADANKVLMSTKLILTPKTKENLDTICEVIHDPVPLLLEGETGVGKSATVDAAAKLTGNKLFRFNMSSRVTIEDFLGKVELLPNGKFGFHKQPFTRAFEEGAWLLLDEVNLAPDQVLQRIESALDSGRLVFSNPSNAADPSFNILQHKNFRLFATQNPNAGFFKGHREELSDSFLSRFRKIHFQELGADEWKMVLHRKLESGLGADAFSAGFLTILSDTLSRYHMAVRDTLQSKDVGFPEGAAYAEITIRELIRCADHVIWLGRHGQLDETNKAATSEWLSLICRNTYIDRFRGSGADILLEALYKAGQPKKAEAELQLTATVAEGNCVKFQLGKVFFEVSLATNEDMMHHISDVVYSRLTDRICEGLSRECIDQACNAHCAVARLMLTTPFITDFGLYSVSARWLTESLERAQSSLDSRESFCFAIAESYAARVRSTNAQRHIVSTVLSCFNLRSVQAEVDNIVKSLAPNDRGQGCNLPMAEWAFVITPRVLRLWQSIILASHLPSPILVVGGDACGKSAAIVALAQIQGLGILQTGLTPETDPSVLVGQSGPVDGGTSQGKAAIEWQDGIVTEALRKGTWVLLDNFNHGEASVLERLNPVLEVPAEWVLSEKGETHPMPVPQGFRVLATMTPPSKGSLASGVELSPALYNRFILINFPAVVDQSLAREAQMSRFFHEVKPMIKANIPVSDAVVQEVCNLCWSIIQSAGRESTITMRNLVRLLNSCFLLQVKHPGLNLPSALWAAFQVTLASQVLDSKLSDLVKGHLLNMNQGLELQHIDFSTRISSSASACAGDLVLTPSRKVQASAVIGCIECGMPVLLEGPAAVGKTALIEYLSKRMLECHSRESPLLRVNNSASTTVQDYLGSYLPSGRGDFHFKEGVLIKAMRCGYWFLADEFNLAEPAVMSILYPILEGQGRITVPGTDKVVYAHPHFQFFATQNHARGYAGRFDLPLSLRNRMLEVQVSDFDCDELPVVIRGRAEALGFNLPPGEAEKIAQVYQGLKNSQYRMTLRDIVKWISRKYKFSDCQCSWGRIGLSLYESLLQQKPRQAVVGKLQPAEADALFVEEVFNKAFNLGDVSAKVSIKKGPGDACTFASGSVSVTFKGVRLEASPLWKDGQEPPEAFKRALVSVAFAVKANEPVLIIGPSCFKSLLVRTWAQICQRKDFEVVNMLPDSETGDIVGQIQPYSLRDLVSVLISCLNVIAVRVKCAHSKDRHDVSYDEKSDYAGLERLIAPNASNMSHLESLLANFLTELQSKKDHKPKEEHETNALDYNMAEMMRMLARDHGQTDQVRQEERGDHQKSGGSRTSSSSASAFEDYRDEDVQSKSSDESKMESEHSESEASNESYELPEVEDVRSASSASGSSSEEGFANYDDDGGDQEESRTYPTDKDAEKSDFLSTFMSESGQWKDSSQHDNGSKVDKSKNDSDDEDGDNSWTKYEDETSPQDMSSFIERTIQGSPEAVKSTQSLSSSSSPAADTQAVEAVASKSDGVFGAKVKKWGASKKSENLASTAAHTVDGLPEQETVASSEDKTPLQEQSGVEEGIHQGEDEHAEHASVRWQDYWSQKEEKSHVKVPPELRESMDSLVSLLDRHAEAWQNTDPSLHTEIERLKTVWELVQEIERSGKDSKPVFLFKDGPVTSAVKRGQQLLIEDFDLPNQAVVERLNSLLEPSPSFSITEDITISQSLHSNADDAGKRPGLGQDIPILPSFQVFATVHAESLTAKINLSPATRSRFTEIYVQPYSSEDLEKIVMSLLSASLPESQRIHNAVELMFTLRDEVNNSSLVSDHEPDIHKLFRMVYFVLNHDKSVDLITRVWLAARFFYFDASRSEYQQELMDNCVSRLHKRGNLEVCSDAILSKVRHIFAPPMAVHGAFVLNDDASNCNLRDVPLSSIIEPVSSQSYDEAVYRLKYTGVCFKTQHIIDLDNKTMASAPIQSFINQVARIFAAICTGCPLLLEGPPGTGKTAVVSQVAHIVTGKDVARINFSANTSLEHLLGAVVPRCVDGRRTFEWQDGKVVQALREGRWLLLDEINLASPEVLDGLARLLAIPGESISKNSGDASSRKLRLPCGQDVDIPEGFHVFATMNPAAIGGGRSRLPRAIANLFASVYLEESTPEEVRVILEYMFADELHNKVLSQAQLKALFELHCTIKGMVKNSDIGRIGGPYEINLRDVAKVRDVLAGNSKDQKYHYLVRQDSNKTSSVEDVNILSLRKFTELVYASPFHSFEDQAAVREQINKYFPLTMGLDSKAASDSDITMVEGSVRIGSIYITQGEAYSEAAPLEHTRDTILQLEMLAAAAQSKRAVLLEGDTCSRKTALVQELARITRHELIVIAMNEDTETSDIIGQWLPMTAQGGTSSFRTQIREVIKGIMRTVVMHCSNLCGRDGHLRAALNDISRAFQHFDAPIVAVKGTLATDRDFLLLVKDALQLMCNELKSSLVIRHHLIGHERTVDELERRIADVLDREEDQGIAFSFIKSNFIKAIENGWWVLLDGVNSAPSEVVERLNSLLEEQPMLSLYEHAEGDVLTSNNGIHRDFRFFATANIYRKNSNKLSSAFLNRMVRIWLPKMDSELSSLTVNGLQNVASTDMMQLVRMKFGGISGGNELALVLLRFHQALQHAKGSQDKLQFVTGFSLSFRCLQQTIRTLLYLVHKGGSPVPSLVWSIQRNYMSAAASALSLQRMCTMLAEELKKSDVMHTDSTAYRALPLSPQSMAAKHEVEARELISLMCLFEEKVFHLVDAVILDLCDDMPTVNEKAISFIVCAFENMYQPRNAHDAVMASILSKAKEKVSTPQNAGKWLVDNVKNAIRDRSSGGMDRLLLLHQLNQTAAQVEGAMYGYLERASFDDVEKRAARIRHVQLILTKFSHVLKFQGALSTSATVQAKVQAQLKGGETAVCMLTSATVASLSWTDSMHDTLLEPLKVAFFTSLEERQDRAAKHAFQMQLNRSILGPPASWPTLSSVVQSLVDLCGCAYEDLMPYCTLLQWKGLQWEFKLNPTSRMLAVAPPGIDFLSADNVIHLEESYCSAVIKGACRALLTSMLTPLDAFMQAWTSLHDEVEGVQKSCNEENKKMRQRQKKIDQARERCAQTELVLGDERKEERRLQREWEQVAARMEDDQDTALASTRADLQMRLQNASERVAKLNSSAQAGRLAIVQEEMAYEHDFASMTQRHQATGDDLEGRQKEVLNQLHRLYEQGYERMEELRRHECFKSLAKMKASPGTLKAQNVLASLQAHVARIIASGRQATPDSIEQEFGKLIQGWPLGLTSAIGKMLIGTFLVSSARDPKGMLLRQQMRIVDTDSAVDIDIKALSNARFMIFFICGASEDEDALSLCILDALKLAEGSSNVAEMHHWHTHGPGSSRHEQWAAKLVDFLLCSDISVTERPHTLGASSGALANTDLLVDECILVVHGLQVDPALVVDFSMAWAEADKEEQEYILRAYEGARTRMKHHVSIAVDDSELMSCVKLVESDLLGKIGMLFKESSMQTVWHASREVVQGAKKFMDSMMWEVSSPFGMFSGLSCDDSKKKVEGRLEQLKVNSDIDRYRALQRLKVLAKLTVVDEIKKRLSKSAEGGEESAGEFEHCDKALQHVRKIMIIFVNVLQRHVQHGTFLSGNCRRLVEAGQAALAVCKELSFHVLSCIDCTSGSLSIRQRASEELLIELGDKACVLLKELGFPDASIHQTDIRGTFAGIAAELKRQMSGSSAPQQGQMMNEPQATESSAKKLAEDTICRLDLLMSDLRKIKPTRYTILNDIRTFIRDLKNAIIANATITEVEKLVVKHYNPIKQKIADVKVHAEAKDSEWLREFEIEELKVILLDRSAENLSMKSTPSLVQIAAQAYDILKGMTADSYSDENVESAKLHVSMCGNIRCWQRLFDICRKLSVQDCDEGMTDLYLFSAIVSEEVWSRIEDSRTRMAKDGKQVSGTSIIHETFSEIVQAYVHFRMNMYDKRTKRDSSLDGRTEAAREEMQKKLFDFASVQTICFPASDQLASQTSFGLLVQTMKSILMRSNAVHNEVRSYPFDLSFHLEPMTVRLADLLTVFFADDLDSIYRLTCAQDSLDRAMVQPNGISRHDAFQEAKNMRRGIGAVGMLEVTEQTKAPYLIYHIKASLESQNLPAVPLFDVVRLQHVFTDTRGLCFKLFDVLHDYLANCPKDRQIFNVFDVSDQIPQWQLVLSMALLHTACAIFHLLYSDQARSHREAITCRIELAENCLGHDVFLAQTALRRCKESIVSLERRISEKEEVERRAQDNYRRDYYANTSLYQTQSDLRKDREQLEEENISLPSLQENEKKAKEAHRELVRARKESLISSVYEELRIIGEEFETFKSRVMMILAADQAQQPTQAKEEAEVGSESSALHGSDIIVKLLNELLRRGPLSTSDTNRLQSLAKDALNNIQQAVYHIDKAVEQIATIEFKAPMQRICHACLCAAYAMYNSISNLSKIGRFEVGNGKVLGALLPNLRALRSTLEPACKEVGEAVDNQADADRIADLTGALFDKMQAEVAVAFDRLAPVPRHELKAVRQAIEGVQGTITRFVFVSCSYALLHTPTHSRLMAMRDKVKPQYATSPSKQLLKDDTAVQEFVHIRNRLSSSIDVCSRLFVPAMYDFVNNAFAAVQDDLDSFIERNMNMQLSAKDVMVPCNLTIQAVKQIDQIFRFLVELSPKGKNELTVTSVLLNLYEKDLNALLHLIKCIHVIFHSHIHGGNSWLDVFVSDDSPINAALEHLGTLTAEMDGYNGQKHLCASLSRLGRILDTLMTETFSSAVLLQKSKFMQRVATLRSNILPVHASPQLGGEDALNWEVFTLDLLLNKEDLYARICSSWRPAPPSQATLDKWFDKFHLILMCLVKGTEALGDLLVELHRCAPQLLTRQTLLTFYQQRIDAAQKLLNIRLLDLVSDTIELEKEGSLRSVPNALRELHQAEIHLFNELENGMWTEISTLVDSMQDRAADGSYVSMCFTFRKFSEEGFKNWEDRSKSFIASRDNARSLFCKKNVEQAEKAFQQIKEKIEREENEWRRQKEKYQQECNTCRQAKDKFQTYLQQLLVRDQSNARVQHLAQKYVDLVKSADAAALWKKLDFEKVVDTISVPHKVVIVAHGGDDLRKVECILFDGTGKALAGTRKVLETVKTILRVPYAVFETHTINLGGVADVHRATVQLIGSHQPIAMFMTAETTNSQPLIVQVSALRSVVTEYGMQTILKDGHTIVHHVRIKVEHKSIWKAINANKVDISAPFDFLEAFDDADRAFEALKRAIPVTRDPGPSRKVEAPKGTEDVRVEAERMQCQGLDTDVRQHELYSPLTDLVKKVHKSSDALAVEGDKFFGQVKSYVDARDVRKLVALILSQDDGVPSGQQRSNILDSAHSEAIHVQKMLANCKVDNTDMKVVEPSNYLDSTKKCWTKEMKSVCLTLIKHALSYLGNKPETTNCYKLVPRLAHVLYNIMVRAFLIEYISALTPSDWSQMNRKRAVYMDYIKKANDFLDENQKYDLAKYKKTITNSCDGLQPRLDLVTNAEKMLELLCVEEPAMPTNVGRETWVQAFNTPIQGTTSILLQRQDTEIVISPPKTYVYFGVVIVGSEPTKTQVVLINESHEAITLTLTMTGNNKDLFMFSGGEIVSVGGISSLTIDLTMRPTADVGRLEACLEVRPAGMLEPFLIPITAVVHEVGFEIKVKQGIGMEQVQITQVDNIVQIDLGAVRCTSDSEFAFVLKNLCGSAVQVQGQVQKHKCRSQMTLSLKEHEGELSIAKMQPHGRTTLALKLLASKVPEDFECYAILGFHSEKNLRWLQVKARICEQKYEVLDASDGTLLTNGTQVHMGNVEVHSSSTKGFRIRNSGQVVLQYKAKLTGSIFNLSSGEEGRIQPGDTARVSVRYKSTKQESLSDTLSISFNNSADKWSAKIKVESGERRVDRPYHSKAVQFDVHLRSSDSSSQESILDKRWLEKAIEEVTLRNAGTLAATVELHPHPWFKVVDGDSKVEIGKGSLHRFKLKLDAFPSLEANIQTKIVFKTNSTKLENKLITVPVEIRIAKACLRQACWVRRPRCAANSKT